MSEEEITLSEDVRKKVTAKSRYRLHGKDRDNTYVDCIKDACRPAKCLKPAVFITACRGRPQWLQTGLIVELMTSVII